MRICVILEGCYPYVTGGVSSWIHGYIKAMPQHEFVIWAIGADPSMKGKFKYTLPDNVVEVKEIFLSDALRLVPMPEEYNFTEEESQALHDFINCGNPNWEALFDLYNARHLSPVAFLMSDEFMNLIMNICEDEYPYVAFSDFFHTVRSMLLPVLYILGGEIPQADVYHAIATGYAGVMARMGSWKYNVPFLITEHGIYTREREEEIIRARWVNPAFKKTWVKFFYMLSNAAYEKAVMVTSLFAGARQTQIDMGCDPDKCVYIGNGINYEKFSAVPPKQYNGYIDAGAVLRVAPIKDVKTMLYAFADASQRVPNIRLWIAGPTDDPEYAEECFALVDQLQMKNVTFLGTINVTDYMKDFDFTMLSSISEGMPLAVLESFASGRPCVTTDVGCCRELITKVADDDNFGDAGYCVPPMYPALYADAIVNMATMNEKRYHMAEAGKARVEKYFRHEDMIKRYLEVYDEVFARWQGSASA